LICSEHYDVFQLAVDLISRLWYRIDYLALTWTREIELAYFFNLIIEFKYDIMITIQL